VYTAVLALTLTAAISGTAYAQGTAASALVRPPTGYAQAQVGFNMRVEYCERHGHPKGRTAARRHEWCMEDVRRKIAKVPFNLPGSGTR